MSVTGVSGAGAGVVSGIVCVVVVVSVAHVCVVLDTAVSGAGVGVVSGIVCVRVTLVVVIGYVVVSGTGVVLGRTGVAATVVNADADTFFHAQFTPS